MTESEKATLHKILKSQQKKLICAEIGSYLGASTCFIANAMPKDSILYCIDTWQNMNMQYVKQDIDAEERDTYFEFRNNTEQYREKIIELRQWSTEAINEIKKQTNRLNFLFIDGDHHYDLVKKDWDLYSPLLKTGSIVALHDTGWAQGVQQVVREDVIPVANLINKLPNLEVYRIK